MSINWCCTLCGQCCKSYTPFILPGDIQRIQAALDYPPAAFTTFYRAADFPETLGSQDKPYLFQTRFGPVVMCISRVRLPDGDAGCYFLQGNTCSIHLHRPLVCRQYPFLPQDPWNIQGAFRLMDAPCFGRYSEDRVVDEEPVRQNYRSFQEQQEAYLKKVREWNDNPLSNTKEIGDFLSFVGLH